MSDEGVMRHSLQLLELANSNPLAALELLRELSEQGAIIEAEVALQVACKCLEVTPPSKPKKHRGRPIRTPDEHLVRILDGKAAVEGKPLSRIRTQREIERCVFEFREFKTLLDNAE